MLILAPAAPSFSTAEARIQGLRHGFPPGLRTRTAASCCVPYVYIYVAQISFSGFGGRKGTSSMGKMSILEVLRLRAHKRCVTRITL